MMHQTLLVFYGPLVIYGLQWELSAEYKYLLKHVLFLQIALILKSRLDFYLYF